MVGKLDLTLRNDWNPLQSLSRGVIWSNLNLEMITLAAG